jgi:hypothetical protein
MEGSLRSPSLQVIHGVVFEKLEGWKNLRSQTGRGRLETRLDNQPCTLPIDRP